MPFDALPPEVLGCIVDWLDPAEDSASLLSLMRVSQALWDPAARRLYASITLDRDQVVLLIAGRGWEPPPDSLDPAPMTLTERTRLALSFVRRLKILGYWTTSIVEMLWAAAAGRDEPLFPNVEQLLLDIGPPVVAYAPPLRCGRPEPGALFIFGTVDVCILGDENHGLLFRLPARRYRSFTCHESHAAFALKEIWRYDDYRRWESWRSFQSDAWESVSVLENSLSALTWDDYKDDRVPDFFHLPPLQLYLNDGVALGEDIVAHWDDHKAFNLRVFSDIPHILQIHHFPPSGEGCPPCELCGMSHRVLVCSFGMSADNLQGKTWRAQEFAEKRNWRKVWPPRDFRMSLPWYSRGELTEDSSEDTVHGGSGGSTRDASSEPYGDSSQGSSGSSDSSESMESSVFSGSSGGSFQESQEGSLPESSEGSFPESSEGSFPESSAGSFEQSSESSEDFEASLAASLAEMSRLP